MQVWQHVQAGGKEGYLFGNNAQLSFFGLSWQERGGGGDGEQETDERREERGEGGGRERRGREEGEEEREGEMVEEYEGQLKYRNGSVSRTRVSNHTKNVTPPQPIMQLLKLLFCGSVRERESVYVCVCVGGGGLTLHLP